VNEVFINMEEKCFEQIASQRKPCKQKQCRYWIDCKAYKNCVIVGAKSSDKITLQNIGEIFKVTRMRICQIEKTAVKKLKEKVKSMM
tara:strand:+ start:668 stop:928 length:261 start_codon:yes stop_codon:yes gene_type:complete